MSLNLAKLRGVFAPVVTPFHNDQLMLEQLRMNLQRLGQSSLKGYLALGSNGEYKSLTDQEQLRVLDIFAQEKGDKVIMVGVGCESTVQTIEKSRIAAGMGFDFVSVLTPSYFAKRMDGSTLYDYYLRIAEAAPLPVLLYNAPGFAGGVQIPISVIVELASHPNILGIKDSSTAGPAKLLSELAATQSFHVLSGSATTFYPALHLGAGGGVLSLTNVLPDHFCRLYQLFREKNLTEALALHNQLTRLTEAVSGCFGVAGVKAAMNLMNFNGGEPRHPLKPLNADATKKIASAMRGIMGINVP